MDQDPKPKSRTVRIIVIAGAVVGLCAATYLIGPKLARSAVAGNQLDETRQQVELLRAERLTFEKDLAGIRVELAEQTDRAEKAEAETCDRDDKLAIAASRASAVTAQLEHVGKEKDSLNERLASVRTSLEQEKSRAAEAGKKIGSLASDVAKSAQARKALAGRHQALTADHGKLKSDLEAKQREAVELKRLLKLLDLGSAEAPADGSAEMPITRKELVGKLGHPGLMFSKNDELVLRWDGGRTARTAGNVATTIDDTPASRELLGSGGPALAAPPAAWRIAAGEKLQYADLVGMFGRPAGISGSGDQFEAWWSVGAWAQQVTVSVTDGVVTKLAGRELDPRTCCELIRHRAEAYRSVDTAVLRSVAEARAAYDRAVEVINEKLKADAVIAARDGNHLVECVVAPFDSVGAWVAPVAGSEDTMTVRAAVDCTWVKDDKTRSTVRGYVVVTISGQGEDEKVNEFAVLTPGD